MMRIGDAAAALGVPAHVLRHWEDVGALVPYRTPAGHRDYDDELVLRGRLVQISQRAGLSLAEIRRLVAADSPSRAELIRGKREEIAARIGALTRADRFLEHVLQCVHPVVSDCPACSEFATAGR